MPPVIERTSTARAARRGAVSRRRLDPGNATHDDDHGAGPERIVLYVADLDRCPPVSAEALIRDWTVVTIYRKITISRSFWRHGTSPPRRPEEEFCNETNEK
jgi:hypothetical protein